MRADCPVINVDERAEELLGEEISMIGLVEINAVSREDACKLSSAQVKGKIGFGRVHVKTIRHRVL